MPNYKIQNRILSNEHRDYIKSHLAISAKILKKYTDLVARNDRVEFRESVLSGKPNLSEIPEHLHADLQGDLSDIIAPKNVNHQFLDGKTIEVSLIEGYHCLFAKWCKGNEDLLQDFILKALNSIYLFTNPEKSLIQYLKRAFQRFRSLQGKSRMQQLITMPDRWNFLRISFENERSQNPHLTINEIMDLMELSKKQRNNLVQQMQATNIARIDTECKNDNNDPVAKESKEIQKIDIESAPLTKLQKDCVMAYMHDSWGWQSKMAENNINPRTNEPYSKMSITNNLREAFGILRQQIDKNIE